MVKHKQCNPNALHNYAYHKQFISNALGLHFDTHSCAMRNKLAMHWNCNAYDKRSCAMHWKYISNASDLNCLL